MTERSRTRTGPEPGGTRMGIATSSHAIGPVSGRRPTSIHDPSRSTSTQSPILDDHQLPSFTAGPIRCRSRPSHDRAPAPADPSSIS